MGARASQSNLLWSQLKAESELSNVQFEVHAMLVRAPGHRLRMTDIADSVVISRSGPTNQVGTFGRNGVHDPFRLSRR